MSDVRSDEDVAVTCILGRCCCGGIIFASVETPEHRTDNAKEVAKLIRGGFSVATAQPLDAARKGTWCTKSKEHMRG